MRSPRPTHAAQPSTPGPTAPDLSGLLDASDRAMLVLDAAGTVLFANARAHAWFAQAGPLLGNPSPVAWSHDATEVCSIGDGGGSRHLQRTVAPTTWAGAPALLVCLQDVSSLRRAEDRLRRLGRLHAALGQTAAALARATEEQAAVEETCRIAVALAEFRAVWIGRVNSATTGLDRIAAAGVPVLPGAELPLHPSPAPGYAPVAQTLRLGAPCICNLVSADHQLAGWEGEARRLDIASLAFCPIGTGSQVQAVMAFYAREPGCFDREAVSVITQIAAEVAAVLERFAGRRQLEQLDALRRSAEQQLHRFRSLVESASDTFYIVSPAEDFRLVYINDAGVRHFGSPREHLLTMRVWEWDPNFTPETTRALWAMLRTRGSTSFETATARSDGSRVRVEVTAHLLRADDGEFLAGYLRDISARARAEADLRESEERFRAVFEEASDALILVDPATRQFIDCNARAVLLFEAGSKERLLETRGPDLVAGSLTGEQTVANSERIAREGAWSGTLEYRTLQGRRFWGRRPDPPHHRCRPAAGHPARHRHDGDPATHGVARRHRATRAHRRLGVPCRRGPSRLYRRQLPHPRPGSGHAGHARMRARALRTRLS